MQEENEAKSLKQERKSAKNTSYFLSLFSKATEKKSQAIAMSNLGISSSREIESKTDMESAKGRLQGGEGQINSKGPRAGDGEEDSLIQADNTYQDEILEKFSFIFSPYKKALPTKSPLYAS